MVKISLLLPADDAWKPIGSGDLPRLTSSDRIRVTGLEGPEDYGAIAAGLGLALLHGVKVERTL